MRPIAKISSVRLCGAMIISSLVSNVFANMLPVCTIGSLDSHGGIAITGSYNTCANGIPVCGLGDINDICRWRTPNHFMVPLVICDINVFIM